MGVKNLQSSSPTIMTQDSRREDSTSTELAQISFLCPSSTRMNLRTSRGAISILILAVAIGVFYRVFDIGRMGQGPSQPLTVVDLLAIDNIAASNEETLKAVNALSHDEVSKELLTFGIIDEPVDGKSKEDLEQDSKKCLAAVKEPGFWSKHCHLHPNHKRVKVGDRPHPHLHPHLHLHPLHPIRFHPLRQRYPHGLQSLAPSLWHRHPHQMYHV